MKYVVVTGGVVSGLGKGITSSSLGVLLKASGLNVTCIKIDPYLNIDAGTMSPYEHGEVFVLDDGGEADLDLGNYERFLDISLSRDHNITTGKIYQHVLSKERQGKYLGKTVQVVPHITDAVMDWIITVAQQPVDDTKTIPDICLIELGGTVGDIESMIYLEALRQLRYKVGKGNFCLVHVSLVPVVSAVGEPKTKPTQHGVRELMRSFLEPDILVCRSSKPLARDIINKLALSCMVPTDNVIGVHDVSNIYKVPLLLLEQRVPSLILRALCINKSPVESLPKWTNLALKAESAPKEVIIGFVGKYTGLSDSYLSVTHALTHAAIASDCKLIIRWIDSQHLEDDTKTSNLEQYNAAWESLRGVNGVLVPGGFGDRGVAGKILAVNFARVNKVPFLGICLGLQVAVIEYARSVLGLKDAHSTEFVENTVDPVVIFMPEGSTEIKGGTMRLGSRRSNVKEGSLAWQLYDGHGDVHERHRHRYEVNPKYVAQLEAAGLVFSGIDDHKERMELVELPAATHPFFIGLQAHPEFKSRPLKPSPPFHGLILASAGKFVRRDIPRRVASSPLYAASSLVTQSLLVNNGTSSPSASPSHSPSSSRRGSSSVPSSSSAISAASRSFLSTPATGIFPPPVTAGDEHKAATGATPSSAAVPSAARQAGC